MSGPGDVPSADNVQSPYNNETPDGNSAIDPIGGPLIRRQFIRKVYSFVSVSEFRFQLKSIQIFPATKCECHFNSNRSSICQVQALLTLVTAIWFNIHKPTAEWAKKNLVMFLIALSLMLVWILFNLYRPIRRKPPYNRIMIVVFTISCLYTAALSSTFFKPIRVSISVDKIT